MRRLAGLLLPVLLVAACGDDGPDIEAIRDKMPDFVSTTESSFPGLIPPLWDDDDDVLVAVLPNDGDPVQLCDALSDYLSRRELDVVPIRVQRTVFVTDAIATGTSGEDCSGA